MPKTLFLAQKVGQPAVFDSIENEHILEVLTNAYRRHGYTVLTAPETEEREGVKKVIEEAMERERRFNRKATYAAGSRESIGK